MSDTEHYAASYSPLTPAADATGGADQSEEGGGAEARFLLRVASLAFRLGPEGIELRQIDLTNRRFTLSAPDQPEDRIPFYAVGPVPDDDGERQNWDYTPLAPSPPWTHLVWLVQQLATQLDFFSSHGARLTGITAPSRSWADVIVEHGGTQWRARVPLEGRHEPIEYPGMTLAEMFGEGRHLRLAEGELIPDAL
ncbi:hypothetical protein [Streptomyces sp. NPDC054887]